jgi:hypothetical protein
MILDERTEFADATAVNAVAGTALIGDVMPLGGPLRDIGNGRPVYLVITCDTQIITGGVAGTVSFQLVSDSTANLATSPTVHLQTAAFVTGANSASPLRPGNVIACVMLPLEGVTYEQFLGILCVTATTTTTAGKINAFLTLDPTGWKAYDRGTF